jgi:hypothetical protein
MRVRVVAPVMGMEKNEERPRVLKPALIFKGCGLRLQISSITQGLGLW